MAFPIQRAVEKRASNAVLLPMGSYVPDGTKAVNNGRSTVRFHGAFINSSSIFREKPKNKQE